MESYCCMCGAFGILSLYTKTCACCDSKWDLVKAQNYGVPYVKGLDVDMTKIN